MQKYNLIPYFSQRRDKKKKKKNSEYIVVVGGRNRNTQKEKIYKVDSSTVSSTKIDAQ